MAAADAVVFLDLPGRACLWGIVNRRLRHRGRQHRATGVYDRITGDFIRYILGYRRKMAPRVRALIACHAGHAQVTILRSRAAVRRYLAAPWTSGSGTPLADPIHHRGPLAAICAVFGPRSTK